MNYSIKQLPNKRWGIYAQMQLIATIGCHQTGQKILDRLQKNSPILDQTSISSGFSLQTKRLA